MLGFLLAQYGVKPSHFDVSFVVQKPFQVPVITGARIHLHVIYCYLAFLELSELLRLRVVELLLYNYLLRNIHKHQGRFALILNLLSNNVLLFGVD